METAYLLLGTNLGDRAHHLTHARNLLDEIGTVSRLSKVYVTAAWGLTDQPDFFNQAIELKTALEPIDLLTCLRGIEKQVGRTDAVRWGPRILDIDILFYGNQIIETDALTIPHPRLYERRFALVPLHDLNPDLLDPKSGNTITKLLSECNDLLPVRLADL